MKPPFSLRSCLLGLAVPPQALLLDVGALEGVLAGTGSLLDL